MSIPEEAIEAGAKLMYVPFELGKTWDSDLDDDYKDTLRVQARLILEAALPHLPTHNDKDKA